MDFNLLINNISNLLITFITIIFSAYIMFTEMYLNRYANKIIKAKDLTISIGVCVALIVLNSVIVSLNYGIIKGIVACLAVIGTVIVVPLFIKKLNKMKIDVVAKERVDKIINKIKENFEKEDLNKEIKVLKDLYIDSYTNNELYVCNYIVKSYSLILEEYLKYANKCALEGNSKNNTFENFISIYFSFLRISLNNEDYNTRKENVEEIYTIIKLLLKCSENKLVDIVYLELKLFFRELCYNENLKAYTHQMYILQLRLIRYVIDNKNMENKKEKLELICENVKSLFMMLLSFSSSFSVNEYCDFFAIICKEDGKNEDVREIFTKPLIDVVHIPNVVFNKDIFSSYALLINEEDFSSEFFMKLLEEISETRYERASKQINYIEEMGFYYFCKNKKYNEQVLKLHAEYMEGCLRSNFDCKDIYFMDYFDIFQEKSIPDEILKENMMKILMISAKTKNKISIMYYLEQLRKIILTFNKEEREKQEKWVNIYSDISKYFPFNSDEDLCQIICENILSLIDDLDDDKKISEKFALYMFRKIEDISEYSKGLNNQVVNILEILTNHEDDYKFLNKTEVLEKFWYLFYKISVHNIESKSYDQIKTISNIFGWKIIDYIKDKKDSAAQSLISYSKKIFQLSVDLCDDDNVNVFLGTLFAIVGGFTMTHISYKKYGIALGNFEKKYQNRVYNIILKSKDLRLSLSKDWDDTIGGDSKKYVGQYIKEYIKVE